MLDISFSKALISKLFYEGVESKKITEFSNTTLENFKQLLDNIQEK